MTAVIGREIYEKVAESVVNSELTGQKRILSRVKAKQFQHQSTATLVAR